MVMGCEHVIYNGILIYLNIPTLILMSGRGAGGDRINIFKLLIQIMDARADGNSIKLSPYTISL